MASDRPIAMMPRREITTGPESFSSSASSVRTGRTRPPDREDAWAVGRSMTDHLIFKEARRLAPPSEIASQASPDGHRRIERAAYSKIGVRRIFRQNGWDDHGRDHRSSSLRRDRRRLRDLHDRHAGEQAV